MIAIQILLGWSLEKNRRANIGFPQHADYPECGRSRGSVVVGLCSGPVGALGLISLKQSLVTSSSPEI